MSEKNIDDLLSRTTQEALSAANNAQKVEERVSDKTQEVPHSVTKEEALKIEESSPSEEMKDEYVAPIEEHAPEAETVQLDEYGNKPSKSRVYTEDEVQRMIRDRLSRGRNQESPTKQEVNNVAQEFTADPNNPETWEVQLENFIEKTIEKKAKVKADLEWRENEARIQADFEAKFTTGMQRYTDFYDVVSGKPITNSMMLAARNLKDPAGFVYAASKNFAGDLDRISRMSDPYQQAAEIGRLDERMRKVRAQVSNAPKPINHVKGDIPQNAYTRPSIDQLIQKDAERLRRR